MNTQTINQLIASFTSTNLWLIVVVMIWSIAWKLIALWKAARNGHMTMFIIMGIVNDVGILSIGYLIWLYFRNKKKEIMSKQTN